MRYAKLKIASLDFSIKNRHAISLVQIRDALLFVFIVLGVILLLIAPIYLSLIMPTGS